MFARIRKSMLADGKALKPGDVVNISEWRNAKALVNSRYVEILNETISDEAQDSETVQVKKPKATKPKTKK